MADNGRRKRLVVVAAALGAILLVLRVVGGRSGDDVDEDAIDRVDTGRSDDEGGIEGEPVETGLERVSTTDTDETADADETADTVGIDDDTAGEVGVGVGVGPGPGAGTPETDDESEDVPVVPTGGRFDDLDVFDVISIVSAGVNAAREEYRNRT